ncbi:hypothetical protein BT96DRAFT_1022994 [Gymnopus androsaceus JB14]|uniref:Uncharacterized protein n=1 Tax=Gymnopus androsaceus JB14 TaxID=1447944 RepID=A0A6A4H8K1_9AGAR|nr:hypothetical protein BT96DRAFT_1022994 [Gymnopus androsaceus JB14]
MPTLYISMPRSSLQYSQPTTPAFALFWPKNTRHILRYTRLARGAISPPPTGREAPLLYTPAHLFSDSSPPTPVPTSFYDPQNTLSSLPIAKPNPLTKKSANPGSDP